MRDSTTAIAGLLCLCLTMGGCLDPDEPGNLVAATVREDPTLPSLQLSSTEVHLETFGDPADPVVVVLHGGPGNDYRYMLRLLDPVDGWSLADEHFVVFWDQRGAGLSQRHGLDALTLEAYLADLEEVVDTFAGDRRVVLLGHSWGGQYAAMYMNAHPQRVAGAVLAEPGRFRWDVEELADDFDFDYFAEHLGDLLWAREFVSMQTHARADYVTSLLLLEDTNGRVEDPSPNWRVGAAVLLELYLERIEGTRFDWTPGLAEVEPEVLFVTGALSYDLGSEFQRRQLPFFPRARIVEIPDAGHTDVVWSKADVTVPILRDYLAQLELQ